MSNFESKITITAIDKVSNVVRGISASLAGLKVQSMALGASLRNVGTAAADFGTKLRGVALGIGAVGASVFYMTKKSAELGESLLNAGQRAGVAVEELQRLRYAAEIAGLQAEDVDQALKFLNKSMAEASTNAKSDAAAAFKSMHISLKGANGELKSAGTVMLEMADKFKKAPDGAKKVATAFATMSRGGVALIPLLNTGTQSMKSMGDEADRLGVILTKEQAEALDSYGDNIQRVEKSIFGLANRVSLELVPSLNVLVTGMLEYISTNKKAMSQDISNFIKDLGSALKAAWEGFKLVNNIAKSFVNALGGVKNVAIAFFAIRLASLIISFVNLTIAIAGAARAFALLSAAFLVNPIGFVLTAIGLVIFAGYKLYKLWPDIKAIFISSWDAILAKVNQVTAVVGIFADALISPFKAVLAVFDLVIRGINAIKSAFSSMPSANLQAPAVVPAPAGAGGAQSRFGSAITSPQSRLGVIPPGQGTQKLDISMKIDAEGRPKDVNAKSNTQMAFKANTGVMMP